MSKKMNLFGRTKEEQEKMWEEQRAKGSLWGRLSGENKYIFTQSDFDRRDYARRKINEYEKILDGYNKKVKKALGV